MAREELKLNQVKVFNAPVELEAPLFQNAAGNIAIKVEHKECEKMVIVFKNDSPSGQTATIKAGDSFMSNHKDLYVAVKNSGIAAVTVESGRFKQMQGEYKGHVIIDIEGELGVLAIELP
ncbi:MAG: hypothetical protein J6S14_12770 [Clostridia bacterium]|nr:hypothetical protein [Clostridia bacterium]